MPSLLDAIRQSQGPPATAKSHEEPYVLVVPELEWAAFLRTGECPWEEIAPGLYQHVVTRETHPWGQPFRLPGDEP